MKKTITQLLALVFIAALTSCARKHNAPTGYEIVLFNTVEDINKFLLDGLNTSTTVTDEYKYTRDTRLSSPVQILTLYDYSSITSEKDKIGYFAKEVAETLGIGQGAYLIAKEYYHKNFRLPRGQYIIPGYQVELSKCGYMPTAISKNLTRGFAVEWNGENITLTTLVIHIKSEIETENTVEMYCPLGYKGIQNLTWNVPYIIHKE
jgi:hypothetical protein